MIRRGRVAAAMLSLALAGTACTRLGVDPAELGRTPTPAIGPVSPLPPIEPGTQPIVQVVERVSPAVVNVRTNLAADAPAGEGRQGTGTGFIVRPDGVAVTNFHVVQGAFSIEVTTADGEDFEARVIGADPNADLAVLRMDAQDLPTVELGDSDRLALGETVVALGFALALEGGPSVTSGIVSAKGRTIEAGDSAGNVNTLEDLIQTDAAINPGNSGGPLVDLRGRVIGINTAGVRAGAAENIGFAIAIDRARPIIEDAIENPEARAAYLGVSTGDVTPAIAAQEGLSVQEGALVVDVAPGTGAEEAGIEPGDVIVEMEGRAIAGSEDVGAVIREREPGDSVSLVIVRGEERLEITATLGVRPLPTE